MHRLTSEYIPLLGIVIKMNTINIMFFIARKCIELPVNVYISSRILVKLYYIYFSEICTFDALMKQPY